MDAGALSQVSHRRLLLVAKALRLLPPEAAWEELHVPTECPVFVSPLIAGTYPNCRLCSPPRAVGPLVYGHGVTVTAQHLHLQACTGGIYVRLQAESRRFSYPDGAFWVALGLGEQPHWRLGENLGVAAVSLGHWIAFCRVCQAPLTAGPLFTTTGFGLAGLCPTCCETSRFSAAGWHFTIGEDGAVTFRPTSPEEIAP